ncbi:MAG: formylmethanofuran dehydrogenase subunit E family protein [Gammaproteobacteria bacterium]|jgi:formylmethanofuran dehydrogenase subunit E
MKRTLTFSWLFLLALPLLAVAGAPTYVEGRNIFIETGVTQPDNVPTWYAPMVAKPYSPVFEMLATRGTQGRYNAYTYAVTVKDMIKWHGHDCEGTSHAAAAVKMAFRLLFPDGIIDRSVLWGISGPSPCWSDAVAFLTGARVQYGNLGFFKDPKYGHAVLIYRSDTGMAVLATWKKGINDIPGEPVVLPEKANWTPKIDVRKIAALKKVVKLEGSKPDPYKVDLLRYDQWALINEIFSRPLADSYQAKVIPNFKWSDWVDPAKTIAKPIKRGDVRLKNYPYRTRPVQEPAAPTE